MTGKSVAVIGAGWAGCAAATELARRGARVSVFEAARVPGGRARRAVHRGHALDNGQHILLGAYRDTLRMMRTIGLDPSRLLLRLPLQMRYPVATDGMDLVVPRLPAPLHMAVGVLRARGLTFADKLSLARFASAARWMDWQLNTDCSVTELLARFDQTDRLTRLMWRPLCIAALNTVPERASAQVFLAVLRDSLGAGRAASDMLLPRVDLSALFPEAAVNYLEKHGGRMHFGSHVRAIDAVGVYWRVRTDGHTEDFSQVIVATPPAQARRLIEAADPALAQAMDFSHQPITTCFLQYPAEVRLPAPMLALEDDPEKLHWGQFVFDRGQLDSAQAGLLAVVVSTSGAAFEQGSSALQQAIASQLAEALGNPKLATPVWASTLTEKRATFECLPAMQRPPNATACPGLWLAGDYTASEYPATLESAVRSGIAAAEGVLKQG